MKKVRLNLSQINFKGMITAAGAGFGLFFMGELTRAQSAGTPPVQSVKQAVGLGIVGSLGGLWGFFTQRTNATDGTAPALPSLSSTHPAVISPEDAKMQEDLEHLDSPMLINIATVLNRRNEQAKREAEARSAAMEAEEQEKEDLRKRLAELEAK